MSEGDSTLQLAVKRSDLEFLAVRGFIATEDVTAVWGALVELQVEDNLRGRQGQSRVSCRRVVQVTGLALAGLGLAAGCVLGAVLASPLIGLAFAVALVAACETLGWLLRTRRGAVCESEEAAHMWAGVCFCVSALAGLPLLWAAVGYAIGPAAFVIGFQVWGFLLLVVAPSVAHLVVSKTRPLASLPLYVHGMVLLLIVEVSYFSQSSNIALGALPPLALSLLFLGAGLFFDYRVHLERFAAYPLGVGLLGLVVSLAFLAWTSLASPGMAGHIWPALVLPVVVVLTALCGWLVGRRIFFAATAILTLMWLASLFRAVDWSKVPVLVVPAALVLAGGLVCLVGALLAKYPPAIEQMLHERLPAWLFTESARRRRVYDTIQE